MNASVLRLHSYNASLHPFAKLLYSYNAAAASLKGYHKNVQMT